MSLSDAKLPSLKDKIEAEAAQLEEKFEVEDVKGLERSKVIKKKSRKNNE